MDVLKTYKQLLERFEPQGWWPGHREDVRDGFDPKFEIMAGAVLTQNTAWKNVEKAIEALYEAQVLDAETVFALETERLAELIRPAGYYNQKARKLKELAKFARDSRSAEPVGQAPRVAQDDMTTMRSQLLSIWGIGRETADCILLYAFEQPIFVVDTYTRRLLHAQGLEALAEADYDDIRQFFESELPSDAALFNEYHALIVASGKYGKSS